MKFRLACNFRRLSRGFQYVIYADYHCRFHPGRFWEEYRNRQRDLWYIFDKEKTR